MVTIPHRPGRTAVTSRALGLAPEALG